MTIASIVFLTPLGAVVSVAVVAPLGGLALAAIRVRQARALLGLAAPPRARRVGRAAAIVAVPALLGLAAAQPALRSTSTARLRTDAQALFVIDVSRSMQASKSPTAPTRLARAKRAAIALRAAIPEVPSGVATLTDRVLPDLLPSPDPAVFDQTVQHAVAIEQPPPANQNVVATTLGALGAVGTQNYFPASAKRRLVVVLTDGESRPFDARQVARALGRDRLVLVHVSAAGESVYDGSQPEPGYRENPTSADELASLAAAARGKVLGERAISSAIRAERSAIGTGPTVVSGTTKRVRTLAPYVVLLALPLLLFLVAGPAIGRLALRLRRVAPGAAAKRRTGEAPVIARPLRR